MPNKEMTDEDKYIYLYNQMQISKDKAETSKDLEIIADNWQQTEDSFDGNTISNALQQMDKEKESKNTGGMLKYNMGGSMLNPPEREEYSGGGRVIAEIFKALSKTTKAGKLPSRTKVRDAVKQVKKDNPDFTKEKLGKEEYKELTDAENFGQGGGGRTNFDSILTSMFRDPTELQAMLPKLSTKASREVAGKSGVAGTLLGGVGVAGVYEAKESLGERSADKLAENLASIPKTKREEFEAEFSKAHNAGKETFTFEGEEYTTEVRKGKMEGGEMDDMKVKYNEGSMLVPPEMEMPEDTYPNIPEDEMAEAEASQLPDDEMEDDYLGYVLGESLDTEEQEYLMGVLEGDERLSSIFDKVMDVAGEFSGEGEVEGLGTGVSDSIPARLSDGEFVFTKKATDQMGADQLQTMMDDAEKAYDGGLQKMAFGGLTSDAPEIEEEEEAKLVRSRMVNADRMPSTNKG